MKLDDVVTIFPDSNFRALFVGEDKVGKVRMGKFMARLSSSPSDERVRILARFFGTLEAAGNSENRAIANRLFAKFSKRIGGDKGAFFGPLLASFEKLTLVLQSRNKAAPVAQNEENARQEKLKVMFADKELQKVLIGDDKDGKLRERNFARNLLALPQEQRSVMIACYLTSLKNQKSTDHTTSAKRMLEKFFTEAKEKNFTMDEEIAIQANEVKKLFADNQGKFSVVTDGSIQFGRYPEATLPVSQFLQAAKDEPFLKKYGELVDQHSAQSPEMARLFTQQNELEENDPGYGPEFEVQLPTSQHLFLIPQPTKKLMPFCDMLVAKKIALIITLCSAEVETDNGKPMIPYYRTTMLQGKEALTDGRKIVCLSSQVLNEGTVVTQKGVGKIVWRQLLVSNGTTEHKVNHLHYENWPDVQPAPDLDLLEQLHEARSSLLQERQLPMVIHCKKGIGRTINVALTDCVIQAFRHQLAQGKKLDEIALNPFEMLFEIRKKRPNVTTHYTHIRQVYEIVGRLYEKLRKASQ